MECCDGTGWTGNPYERCTEHYEPPSDWYRYAEKVRDFNDDYGPEEV